MQTVTDDNDWMMMMMKIKCWNAYHW